MKYATTQFIKFCIVGVLNTAIDLNVYFFITRHIGLDGELIYLAKGISFLIATLNSFILNHTWTFQQERGLHWKKLPRFYAAVGSGVIINITVHFLNVHFLGINDILSGFIAAIFTAVWGFMWTKYFIFK